MNIIAIIILSAIFADLILHITADVLNLKMLSDHLPEQFQGWYDEKEYRKSQAYLRVNTRFEWFSQVVNLFVFLGIWFGKGFPFVDDWVRTCSTSPILTGLLYIGLLSLLKLIIGLPFSIYSTFVIEERFGFNKTSVRTFISDMIKQIILGICIGSVLMSCILAFFEYAGPNAWWLCWVSIVCFMILMQLIVPTWIMPLFNKFELLDDGELRSAILSYAESIKFPLDNVFKMDGSRRSQKANAFFTGFGRYKRIVLYDTLIENHTIAELVSIIAHEMGHYKKKHILWMLIAGVMQAGIMLYVLSLFISSQILFDAFYMHNRSVYAGLIFFGLLYAPIDFFMGIIMQIFSRKNEYDADRFSVNTTKQPGAFVAALKKLSVHNLSNLVPHPLYVFLNYSHPPVLDRIKAISVNKSIQN